MSEQITPEVVEAHNITQAEYKRICELLGREPNLVELGMFSALWSEHCSYKSSKYHLKRLPTQAEWVIQGPGENAGVIDIGHGLAAVFKIESHNHPSYVEPFQGAATGVGGILRDVFAMGARPIALMDGLRFGPLREPANRLIMRGVVHGIAHYGNCVGVPTVGGDVYFEPCYSTNPLVNVFCLGLARKERLHFARPSRSGMKLLYVGSETGRDGIHGANILASRGFDETAEEKRPTVQIGDPFMEKKILEACLELMKEGCIDAVQDMGAAGLTSSSVEMAGKSGLGVLLLLDNVPLREDDMTPYEILLSESQERMLLILKESAEEKAFNILKKWDIPYTLIGELTADKRVRVEWHGTCVADVPVSSLTHEAPEYNRPQRFAPLPQNSWEPLDEKEIPRIINSWLQSEDFAHRQWIYRQYDHMVRINTIRRPGQDASVLRVKHSDGALAISLDGNGRLVAVDPYLGAALTVGEAARNVVLTGARPLAITNCLNFGNPEDPVVMAQFAQVIDGMAHACEVLETPVVSGNVSFYNETNGKHIFPTPIIGTVGYIDTFNFSIPSAGWVEKDDVILLVGWLYNVVSGSQLAKMKSAHYIDPPVYSPENEKKLIRALESVIRTHPIHTAHDCSEGGLLWTLLESTLLGRPGLGARIMLPLTSSAWEGWLCGEWNSAVIFALPKTDVNSLIKAFEKFDVPATPIGKVTAEPVFELTLHKTRVMKRQIDPMRKQWRETLIRLLSIQS